MVLHGLKLCYRPTLITLFQGGTADITIHEKTSSGKLLEIHRASGGAWGGCRVDKAFLGMLAKLVKNCFLH